ncbi:MAG: hypothetical protein WC213_00145 [Arenimonas sp.]|jgi:hypothetical protein
MSLNAIVAMVAISGFIGFALGFWIASIEAESASHGEPMESDGWLK